MYKTRAVWYDDTMNAYEIDIDTDADLAALALAAGATFTNIDYTDDAPAFGTVARFTATDDDVRAYAAYYDAHDAITPL